MALILTDSANCYSLLAKQEVAVKPLPARLLPACQVAASGRRPAVEDASKLACTAAEHLRLCFMHEEAMPKPSLSHPFFPPVCAILKQEASLPDT